MSTSRLKVLKNILEQESKLTLNISSQYRINEERLKNRRIHNRHIRFKRLSRPISLKDYQEKNA